MKASSSLEAILRKSVRKPAKANISTYGHITIDDRDRKRFANGQRVRVLQSTNTPVINPITGEVLGVRNHCIGTGTIKVDGRRITVELDNPEITVKRGISLSCINKSITVSPHLQTTKPHRNSEKLQILIQESHD